MMGKNSGPPKCKTCGKEEWRHICGPKALVRVIETERASFKQILPLVQVAPKTDRKEYLKLKARERRARQKLEGK